MPGEMEEIIEKKPSHPATTMLIIAAAAALMASIVLQGAELRYYVNPQTQEDINSNVRPLDKVRDWLDGQQRNDPYRVEEAAGGAGGGGRGGRH